MSDYDEDVFFDEEDEKDLEKAVNDFLEETMTADARYIKCDGVNKHGDKTYTVIREADYYWWIDNNMKRVYQRIVYCAYCNVQISCEDFVY